MWMYKYFASTKPLHQVHLYITIPNTYNLSSHPCNLFHIFIHQFTPESGVHYRRNIHKVAHADETGVRVEFRMSVPGKNPLMECLINSTAYHLMISDWIDCGSVRESRRSGSGLKGGIVCSCISPSEPHFKRPGHLAFMGLKSPLELEHLLPVDWNQRQWIQTSSSFKTQKHDIQRFKNNCH